MTREELKEPCEDAVSRQEVAEVLLKYAHSTEGKAFAEFLVSQMNDLPPVTPQPTRWIPISERLPELGRRVLCQCRANIYEILKLTVDGWYYDQDHCYMESFVIAWMPLPEPYKGE